MESDFISEFKLDHKYVRLIRLRYSVAAILLWLYIGILNEISKGSWQENGKNVSALTNLELNLITILVLGSFTVFILYRDAGSKFNGFRILLNEQVIAQTNSKNVHVYLEFSKIRYVIKTYSGSLLLYDQRSKPLVIPYLLEGFDKLENIIKDKVPVFIAGPYAFYEKYSVAVIPIFIALFFTILALQNKVTISLLGAFLVCGVLFIAKKSSKMISSRGIKLTKASFIAPSVFIAVIIFAVVQKLLENK